MIIVRNRVIPFGGYDAMALWPFVFTKGSATERTVRHERIHGEQQKELLLVGFYVLYSLFFLFLLVKHRNWDKATGPIPLSARRISMTATRNIRIGDIISVGFVFFSVVFICKVFSY